MQKVTVLCVGKLKERFYMDAAAEYAKRLSRFCQLEIVELPEERLPDNPRPRSTRHYPGRARPSGPAFPPVLP